MTILSWTCLLLSLAQAQPSSTTEIKEPATLYASFPQEERHAFRIALRRIIALEKAGKWEEVYTLLDDDHQIGKDAFVRRRGQLRLVAFEPRQIYRVPPSGVWVVSGCAVLSPTPPLLRREASGVISSFTAKHTADGWRFSAPPAVVLDKDSPHGLRKCDITP